MRFLAWFLLNEDIQTETHDSIEDARTALKLWRLYESLKAEGKVESTLKEVYRRGREVGFKVPSGNSSNVAGGTGIGTGVGTASSPAGRKIGLGGSSVTMTAADEEGEASRGVSPAPPSLPLPGPGPALV